MRVEALNIKYAKTALKAGANIVATDRNMSKLIEVFDKTNNVICLTLDVCCNKQATSAAEEAT